MTDELSLTDLNRKVGEHIMGVDYSDATYYPETGMYFWKSDKTMLHEAQFTSELNMAWVVLSTFVQKYAEGLRRNLAKIYFVESLMSSLRDTYFEDDDVVGFTVVLFDKLTPEKMVRAVWAAYEEMESGKEEL